MSVTKSGDIPTVANMWLQRQEDILKHTLQQEYQQAGRDYFKVDEINKWAEWLFALSEPQLLHRGLHSFVPRQVLESIHDAIQNRMRNKSNRLLQVLVLGGSVPAGTSCSKSPFDFLPSHDGPKVRYACVWPSRLGHVFNKFLGDDVVRIDNMALGGTTSDHGAFAIQHRLWEEDPDIIIASFAPTIRETCRLPCTT